jgi:hypothetical protein
MIRSSPWFTRLRTSVSSAERLSHIGGDQLGIAFVAILPLCKCLRAQKTWNLIFPNNRIRAKHVEVVTLSSSRRSTAFVQPSFCIGCATQKLLIRYGSARGGDDWPAAGAEIRLPTAASTAGRCRGDGDLLSSRLPVCAFITRPAAATKGSCPAVVRI